MSRRSTFEGEEKASQQQQPTLENANALFQRVPRLEDMLLGRLAGSMEKLNELIGCDETSPLWRQYKLDPDRQRRLRDVYLPQVTQHLLELVAKHGKQDEAEAMIKANPALLLEVGQVETYAQDLDSNPVVVEGTAFRLALGAEDDDMKAMIERYLDEHYPGEKLKQRQEQFPEDQKERDALRQQQDLGALNKILIAIDSASDNACEQVLDHEENIAADDQKAQQLVAMLREFREHLRPKEVIRIGKHFNAQLLIRALDLFEKNYEFLGGLDSRKNNLYWRKVIGYIQRLLPTCYA